MQAEKEVKLELFAMQQQTSSREQSGVVSDELSLCRCRTPLGSEPF